MPRPKLLVIDTAYTYETICKRGMYDALTSVELGGFFERVWTVHPVATLTTSTGWSAPYGRFIEHRVNDRHVFIEGKVTRFRLPKALFAVNFLMSQAELFLHLWRLMRRERIAVIRAGDPLYSGLVAWALSRVGGIPFIVRLGANHDKYYEVVGRPLMPRLFRWRKIERLVERFVLKRAAFVAGANRDYADFAARSGTPPERVTIFGYGNLLDRSHFVDPLLRGDASSELEGLGVKRGKYLLYIGRLLPGKRPDDIVRVLAELRARGHNLKAVLVGEGAMRDELELLAAELRVSDQVILAGGRSQHWLAQVIPHAAAVLSPATGRALSEAALGGAAVVAYDIDWQGEIIRHGETGELVPFSQWLGMADAVERIIMDPDYSAVLGAGARRAALEMFEPSRLIDHEREVYGRLIQAV